ncbi:hypothetical protein L465_00425 [Enterobacter sp. BIDMC 29]|uniref:MipA/OmpV family protein n=1 Tax=Enterobacter sp. BIDMC 29 TaxID=1329841 RepID=UPI000446278C|nr:MipA/OmpV family protein [Enterobacter sp. BIDMC 29]EUM16611.1 hypothetical protein L465_00425 [Enterobacter sp. BIDMC 29]
MFALLAVSCPGYTISLGAEGGIYESAYHVKHADRWFLPYIGYQLGDFYIDGTELGYNLYDDNTNSLKLKGYYLETQFDSDSAKESSLRKLDNRHSTLMAGLNYTLTTTYGAFSFTSGVDTLNQSKGVTANFTYMAMSKWGNLTVVPMFGVDWNNRKFTRYYYGITSGEASRSELKIYQPRSSYIPFVSVALNYNFSKDWNLWSELTERTYSSEITNSPMVNKSAVTEWTLGVSYDF